MKIALETISCKGMIADDCGRARKPNGDTQPFVLNILRLVIMTYQKRDMLDLKTRTKEVSKEQLLQHNHHQKINATVGILLMHSLHP